jgi:hypothetical protein
MSSIKKSLVSLKLTSINYLLWERQVLSLIKSQDLLGFFKRTIPLLEGEIIGPNEDDKAPKLGFVA